TERREAEQLAFAEGTLDEHRMLLSTRTTFASNVREEMAALNGEVERLRAFRQQSQIQTADLRQRIESGHAQVAQVLGQAAEQQALLDQQAGALETARAERNRLREIADQLEQQRQEKSDRVRTHEKALADARETLMRTIARSAEARNQVHQIEVAVEKCQFYLGKLHEAARRASESRDFARMTLSEQEASLRVAEPTLVEAQHRARDAAASREELPAQRDAMREYLS